MKNSRFISIIVLLMYVQVWAQTGPPNWNVNPGDYQFNANVIVKIQLNNSALPAGANVLGAFAGTQPRGNVTAINFGNDRIFFLTMYANTSGEVIRFKVYLPAFDSIALITDSLIFIPNEIYGTVSQPLIFHAFLSLDRPPVLTGIPDQSIYGSGSFQPINLDDYLLELDGDSVAYSFTADSNLTVSIEQQSIVRVIASNANWTGSGMVVFKVQDITGAGLSSTDTAIYTVKPNPLIAPTVLTGAALRNPLRIQLHWLDNSLLEQKYIIERKTGDSASVNSFAPVDTLPANSTMYNDTEIIPSTLYTYRVYALNDSLASAYSNMITILSLNNIQAIPAPDSLIAVQLGSRRVRLLWRDNSNSELGFSIERKVGDSISVSAYTIIDSVSADVTLYIDTTLQSDTAVYTYRVRAFNQDTVSVYSNQAVSSGFIPVELSGFSAQVEADRVKLHWKTVSEKNNLGFRVQRAGENQKWVSLEFIGGNGTTIEPHSYTYDDENILTGERYRYRLAQIDFDGSVNLSPEIKVFTGDGKEEYRLAQNYPNPFNPNTTIEYYIPKAAHVQLAIYDVTGSLIATRVNKYQEPGSYRIEFSTSDLKFSSSVLFYVLSAEGQIITIKKMIAVK